MSTEFREYTDEEYERYETAYDLLSELPVGGIEFWLAGGKVGYRPASRLSDSAVSELRRCKAEVAEILREEDKCEAQWQVRLAAAPEVDVMPEAEIAEFDELATDQQLALWRWIGETLEPAPAHARMIATA